MKSPKVNWIKILFGFFSIGNSQKETDLPAWFLEQVKKNREMWIYWHHPNLFALLPGFFWEDLGKILRETDHKIYIVCSPLVLSELGNEIFDGIPKSLKGWVEILKSRGSETNDGNSFFISRDNTCITGIDGKHGAFFNNWSVNQACRLAMKKLISAALPVGKKIEMHQAVFN
ncbi:MAG: hypothetical protein WCV41_03450 [Patescibacteria group bacterium]